MAEAYDGLLAQLHATPRPTWTEANEKVLLEPYAYLRAVPGKEIRSQLIDAFNVWLKLPSEVLDVIKALVGQLHTASLMMDDVEDASELRRGIPVAHKIYGVPQTINTANYVYFLAFQQLFELQRLGASADVAELVTDELVNLHRGQGMDIFWRDHSTCPTEEQYIEMVNNKTGGLLRIGIKLMTAAAKAAPLLDKASSPNDYVPLVNLIGIWFQIRDDYMNLQSDQYAANKGFAEDLTEGKFSFPLIHAIRTDPSNLMLINLLRQRPTDHSTKTYAVEYMATKTQSFQYTRDVMRRLATQARAEVARLGGNPNLEAILDKLTVQG